MQKPVIAIAALLTATVAILFASPFIIGYIYNVPSWYLSPSLAPSTIIPLEGKMNVTVTPSIPVCLGDPVTVCVIDASNGSAIEYATIQVSHEGTDYAPLLTDSTGNAAFEYPGEPTIIRISRENYETVNKVIPRIPDQWIRADGVQWIFNILTLVVGSSSSLIIVVKFRSDFTSNKKRNQRRSKHRDRKGK